MSRLCARTHTGTLDKPAITRTNKKVVTIHSWDTEGGSKEAVIVITTWYKDMPKPSVIVELRQDVAYEVIGPKGNTIALTR